MLANAGQDATTQFEDINHPPDAMDMMPDLFIGEYKPPGGVANNSTRRSQNNSDGSPDFLSKMGLMILFGSVMVFLYLQLTGKKPLSPFGIEIDL